MPTGEARYGQVFHWMRAARYAGVPWPQFRRLSRGEQGQVVAFYEVDTALAYLEETAAVKRARQRTTGKSRV